jgi:hypothetical protein
MATTVEHLFSEALALDNDHRIELAELLMGSISIDPEIFAEQLAVSHRRLQEVLSGEVEPVSEERAFQMIRESASKRPR